MFSLFKRKIPADEGGLVLADFVRRQMQDTSPPPAVVSELLSAGGIDPRIYQQEDIFLSVFCGEAVVRSMFADDAQSPVLDSYFSALDSIFQKGTAYEGLRLHMPSRLRAYRDALSRTDTSPETMMAVGRVFAKFCSGEDRFNLATIAELSFKAQFGATCEFFRSVKIITSKAERKPDCTGLSVTERHFIQLCGQALSAEAKEGAIIGAANYTFSIGLRDDSRDAVREHLLEHAFCPAMMELAGSTDGRDQLEVVANWYSLSRTDATTVAAYWRKTWSGLDTETQDAFRGENQSQNVADDLVFLDATSKPDNTRCNRAREWGIGRAGEGCRRGLTRRQWENNERELGTPPFGIFRGLVAWIRWEVRQESRNPR